MNVKSDVVPFLVQNMQRATGDALVEAVMLATRSGVLSTGDRLPTIAELAPALGLSTSTVSRAWSSLVQMGVLDTKRRGGTRVAKPVQPTSYRTRGVDRSQFRLNLGAAYPDLRLQVDLSAVMAVAAERGAFQGYLGKDEITPALRSGLLARLGYEPEDLMLASDIIGSLPRVLQAVAHRGSVIGIGDPEFPLYPTILKQSGMTPSRIPFGELGYDLPTADRVLASGARVLLLQTRVHNPTGRTVPTANLQEIARLLRKHDALAIEIDHHGALVPEADVRLASMAPERVVTMASFAKDIHADIRVAAIAGPVAVMERVSVWRAGGDWVSAVNRCLLEACLTDASVAALIEAARAEYDRRRGRFREAFAARGVDIRSNAGLSLWVPVDSEQEALVSLAANGIAVAGGSAFTGRRPEQQHVHLSLGAVGGDLEHVLAEVLTAATILPARPPS